MNKSYQVRLYPNKEQQNLIDKTIGSCRFIYNLMLRERIDVYESLKDDKDALYNYKYKTEKEYKQEYPFLAEVSSQTLIQARRDLESAYRNFFRGLKKGQAVGFPKFKSRKKHKWSYRDPQIGNKIRIENNKLRLPKFGFVRIRGLSKNFKGEIKSVTVTRTRSNKYIASILVEQDIDKKKRVSDNICGVDLGLKEFAVCSNGDVIKGIRSKITQIENEIKKQQRHLSRKEKGSNRYEKCRIKLNRLYDYKRNYLDHFQWHLANRLCSENQAISLENLNVAGMVRNRKLSHAVHTINWSSFVSKLKQKAIEYDTEVYEIDRFFPSSKMCSQCGKIKEDLTLSDRYYICGCGMEMDRDLNAAINIKNAYLLSKQESAKYVDNKRGEIVRPRELVYNDRGSFDEALNKTS